MVGIAGAYIVKWHGEESTLITVLLLLARLSLLYNSLILASVTLDLDWVRTRAAGGNFDHFPLTIRALYAVQTCFTLFLIWYVTRASQRWAKILTFVFAFSTLLQLISRSPDERWNAIPAALIAVAFARQSKERS